MATPGASVDITNPNVPGSPMWWFSRLGQRLMDRQSLYELREAYTNGNHPLPNGDRRYVKALREVQDKAKTNYITLVQRAITQKLRPKGFRFGAEGFADPDAQKIWQSNDMDFQAPILIQRASQLGFSYAIVLPPEEPGGEPVIALRDPRRCEIERDPNRPTRVQAGLEFWQDESQDKAFGILYLPDAIYYFESTVQEREPFLRQLTTYGMPQAISRFHIVAAQNNPLGEVPLQRCDWVPAAGEVGEASGEEAWDIQNRINTSVLDRLVISRNQAYRQRWVTGAPTPKKGAHRPPWDPGADILWLSTDSDTKFGDFQEADIRQILEAIRDDIGDLAATTQTPATLLVNRPVNVSGDALAQVQSGHIARCKEHQDTVGFFLERLLKLAFKYKNDSRATDVTAQTLWWPLETRSFAEIADAFQKLVASGIPLQLAMEYVGQFTDEQIQFAVAEAERVKQEEEEKAEEQLEMQAAAKAEAAQAPPVKTPSDSE